MGGVKPAGGRPVFREGLGRTLLPVHWPVAQKLLASFCISMLLVLLVSREGLSVMDAAQVTINLVEDRNARDVRETQTLARTIEAIDNHVYALTDADSVEEAVEHEAAISERVARLFRSVDLLATSDVMDPWTLERMRGLIGSVQDHAAELVLVVKQSVDARRAGIQLGRDLLSSHAMFEHTLSQEYHREQSSFVIGVDLLRREDRARQQMVRQLHRAPAMDPPTRQMVAAALAHVTARLAGAELDRTRQALLAAASGIAPDGIAAQELRDALARLAAASTPLAPAAALADIATLSALGPRALRQPQAAPARAPPVPATAPTTAQTTVPATAPTTAPTSAPTTLPASVPDTLAGFAERTGEINALRAEISTVMGMRLSASKARNLTELSRYGPLFDAARVNAEAALRRLEAHRTMPALHDATLRVLALAGPHGVFDARREELSRQFSRDQRVARLERVIQEISADATLLSTAASANATLATSALSQRLSAGQDRTLVLAAVAFLVCGLVAVLIMRAVSNPLRAMARLMRDIARGEYGAPIPYQARCDELGEMARSMEVFADAMRDLSHSRDDLRRTALTDPLTGLPNRRGLAAAMTDLSALADAKTQHAVMHVDLDRFKAVNDTLGHAAGDHVLMHCARILTSVTRRTDIVARVGGDEFAVLCRDPATQDLAAAIATRLIEEMSEPIPYKDRQCQIGASIGIALWKPSVEPDGERALADADIALYDAKSDGRGRHCFFEEAMRYRILHSAELAREIEQGLDRDEFEPFLQPQIDLTTGALVGYEALARWRHPRRGLLHPSDFLEAAEEARLLDRLDERMLTLACSALRQLERGGFPAPQVSVNICASRLGDPALVDSVKWTVDQFGLKTSQLGIEVLESVLLNERAGHAPDNIRSFAAAGFPIELDDFGTGHAAISNLRKFPVDRLKIDRDFVAGIDADNELRMITEAISRMGHSLGLQIMAEGVETEAELAVVRALGCDTAQGFLIARPMPLDELERWLSARAAQDPTADWTAALGRGQTAQAG
ncbi:MAG: EAL domain-containing protein [Pseudomonadota bacterium]